LPHNFTRTISVTEIPNKYFFVLIESADRNLDKMVKTRMLTKICPECNEQTAVASKKCTGCGHKYSTKVESIYTTPHIVKGKTKRTAKASPGKTSASSSPTDTRRRTSRVSRGKPNYYDALQFEKKKKIKKKGTKSALFSKTTEASKTTKPNLIAGKWEKYRKFT
jgi:hypothetical protein